MVILVGESGCGKTTTLKMINRLIEPTGGMVTVAGTNAADVDPVELRRSIGYVFQGIGLFPHMTVAENIGIVPRLIGWTESKIDQRVDELLALVGLGAGQFRDRMPAQLSGGQQQRIGLARALAIGPKIMLMDEPFGALDPITRAGVIDQFKVIQNKLDLTVVMVTHDMAEALILGDSLIVMKAGKIVASGTPTQLLHDAGDKYAADLLATPRRQAEQLTEIARREARP
jgi:osmoprotectant transport system ATP-binding protein